VSGDLAVRDFDVTGAYERWRDENETLARELPTVKTARGFHVYARSPDLRFRKLPDGEWRTEGHYVAAPPSLHPRGVRYTWVIEPPRDGIGLLVDPVDAGLVPRGSTVVAPDEGGLRDRRHSTTGLNWSTLQFLDHGVAIGDRNDRLFDAACDLAAHHHSLQIALRLLLRGYRRCVHTPEHPLDEAGAVRTIRSAYSQVRHGPIKRPHPLDGAGAFGVQRVTRNGNDTMVWSHLQLFASVHPECFPNEATIAQALGLSRATVSGAVKRLEELGLLTVHRSRGRGNRYELLFPPDLLDGVEGAP
jgi:biotin operon repressor